MAVVFNVSNTSSNASRCPLFPGEESRCDILVYCKRASSILSIFGCTVTIVIIVLSKRYRDFAHRLVANLSIASFIFALSFIISDFESEQKWLCTLQAFLITYSQWAIMLCIIVIALTQYSEICHDKPLRHFEKLFTILVWSLPGITAGVPFIDHVYAPAGAWCWMENKFAWRFGDFYIWDGVTIVIFIITTIRISLVLRRKALASKIESSGRKEIEDDIRNLRWYPVIYVLVFIGSWANRLDNVINRRYTFSLLLLQTITVSFFGASVAIAFVLNKKTRIMLIGELRGRSCRNRLL